MTERERDTEIHRETGRDIEIERHREADTVRERQREKERDRDSKIEGQRQRFNKITIQGTHQMAVDKEARAYRESTHIVILSVPCPYTTYNLP